MKALTPDDLLPLEEFVVRRRELFDAHSRYLARYRRVRIGPRLTLLFENRQTLWFRLQEVLRVARLAEPARVRRELDLYNRLLPTRNCLQAALVLTMADPVDLLQEFSRWQQLRGEDLILHVGPDCFAANLLTCRPEDRCAGTAHWVQFVLNAAGRKLLADLRQAAHFSAAVGDYQHESAPLRDEVRQSLLEDLALSDRDAS